MQVVLTCSEGIFPDVPFTVIANTLVKDAINTAVEEWGVRISISDLKLMYGGVKMNSLSTLVSHGIGGGAHLEVCKELLGYSLQEMTDGGGKVEELLQSCDDDGFLPVDVRTLSKTSKYVSSRLSSLSFIKGEEIIDVPSDVTSYFNQTHRLKFPSLSKVKTIGNNFISHFTSLTEIDFSGLSSVGSIGNNFLSDSHSLKVIDLSPFIYLEHLGESSLSCLSSLSSLNLNLPRLKSLPDLFLECSGFGFRSRFDLETVDLSYLTSLTHIGGGVLSRRGGVKVVEFGNAMCGVTEIGSYFLSESLSLESLDFSSFTNLDSISHHFLMSCTYLKSVDFSGFRNLHAIGGSFLSNCPKLTALDLSAFTNTKSIGDFFLTDCAGLENVNLSGLIKVVSFGSNCFQECRSLERIDFSRMMSLTSVGGWFLRRCRKLKSVDFSGLCNFKEIGRDCLIDCDSLIAIEVTSLHCDVRDSLLSYSALRRCIVDTQLEQVNGTLQNVRSQTLSVIDNMKNLNSKIGTLSKQLNSSTNLPFD